MRRLISAVAFTGLLFAGAAVASAGPIIIDGTDANDHGFASGGVNQTGWLYMQKALENLAAQCAGCQTNILTLGLSGSQAGAAYNSAFGLSSLAGAGGWTTTNVDGSGAIGAALGSLSFATTGILYIPTYNLSSGDLTSAEMAAINANATAIANFVNAGGGLFAMGQSGTGAWGWLTTLIPGLIVTDIGGGGVGTDMTLTAAGTAAFPGLTNAQLAGADPWHNYFSGNLGSLSVLATALQGGNTRAVIIGGGTTTQIVPEPATLLLLGVGACALFRHRRSRRAV
jgi:hypothetical protein